MSSFPFWNVINSPDTENDWIWFFIMPFDPQSIWKTVEDILNGCWWCVKRWDITLNNRIACWVKSWCCSEVDFHCSSYEKDINTNILWIK
jgi:hypothetical protein